MKLETININQGSKTKGFEMSSKAFDLEPRLDILTRVVNWQLAKRRAGTHDVKNRSEVSFSKKKIYRQKGTGSARHGARSANLFRKGGRSFGPTPRSYYYSLPKKIRKLGLRMAIASKLLEKKLMILDNDMVNLKSTSAFVKNSQKLNLIKPLFIVGKEQNDDLIKIVANVIYADVLLDLGANVYDILNHDNLIISKASFEKLEARLAL